MRSCRRCWPPGSGWTSAPRRMRPPTWGRCAGWPVRCAGSAGSGRRRAAPWLCRRGGVGGGGRGNAALGLAVEVDDPDLADLPWETLSLPAAAGALALDRSVQLCRRVPVEGAVPVMAIPGPLRILVVIASPDAGGGE